jgi:putative ABC transport system ATP-binding protein
VSGLRRSYRSGNETLTVLAGVDLAIAAGELLALMGPSGSGKSTLLGLLGALDQPSAGRIEVNGLDLSTLSRRAAARWRAANVGFVFQLYNLLPELTALGNVELPMLLMRLSARERRRRARTALQLVGLDERASHRPAQLSGGQQQRVAIARAIVADPPLILCDEPTGNLDRSSTESVLDILEGLSRDHGKAVVMVTHDPHAARRASRVLELNKGVLSGDVRLTSAAAPAYASGGQEQISHAAAG